LEKWPEPSTNSFIFDLNKFVLGWEVREKFRSQLQVDSWVSTTSGPIFTSIAWDLADVADVEFER
jgi:hypothetical protein